MKKEGFFTITSLTYQLSTVKFSSSNYTRIEIRFDSIAMSYCNIMDSSAFVEIGHLSYSFLSIKFLDSNFENNTFIDGSIFSMKQNANGF
jgi:hypothetical protein